MAWDSVSGIPVCNAIVWQCRRTAPECERLRSAGMEQYIKDTTGLLIDPYFSGTKMKWILEHVPAAKELAEKDRLRFGTIDTWLVYSLTDGASYVTDVSNASRTMLFDIYKLQWDDTLLRELGIPRSALPRVAESGEIVGMCKDAVLGEEIPIAGMAGDQQAALFGQCCFEKGMAKNTYGTGCFVLMNTGEKPVRSENGLLTTIAWKLNGKTTYALEGSAFNAGSAIQWLRDELELIKTPQEADQLAETVEDSGGVSFVPAFTGLGAPYWDMYARGSIFGLTRGAGRSHIVRAALEAIAYQTNDVLQAMAEDAGQAVTELKVDGGACRNDFLMQFQADIINCVVKRPAITETTALGVAYLAGLAVNYWSSKEEIAQRWHAQQQFAPQMEQTVRDENCRGWQKAVSKAMHWTE